MKLSCITCTSDRPWAMARAEYLMARQTVQPDEWLVADDGKVPATLTQGQRHLRLPPQSSGSASLATNLLAALKAATGDYLVIIEDDDWYAPTYLEACHRRLGEVLVAGEPWLRYYHVGDRRHATFPNGTGSGMFQTALRRDRLPDLMWAAEQALAAGTYDIDGRFWKGLPPSLCRRYDEKLTVGIKGMPGKGGLGIGHRPLKMQLVRRYPNGRQFYRPPVDKNWTLDPDGQQLRDWLGPEADFYLAFSDGHHPDGA